MSDAPKPEGFSLSRWSRRKLEASRAKEAEPPIATAAGAVEPPAVAGNGNALPPPGTAPAPVAPVAPQLPPVESLTIDSDFAPFLRSEVDEGTRRAALKKLFRDPQFNVMDGLDVYIDDYGKTVPIPDAVLGQLAHARYLFDPPRTRVNERGFVEDVPDEPAPAAQRREEPPAVGNAAEDAVSDAASRPAETPDMPQPAVPPASPVESPR